MDLKSNTYPHARGESRPVCSSGVRLLSSFLKKESFMNRRYKLSTFLPLFIAGLLACGCDQIIAQDLVRDSLLAGVKSELQKIPGLIFNVEELFGSFGNNGDG